MATKNVIFIDDDPTTRYLATRTSNRLNCDFLFFERITDVMESIGSIGPKLMIIDLMMTNLDGVFDPRAGIQIAAAIRQGHGNKFPIVILTGSEDPALISDCLRSGADDYFVKGEDFVALLKRVAAWLVVDYRNSNPEGEREAAANVLDKLVARQGVLTVREWRQVALTAICRNEGDQVNPPRERNATSDLFAWRPSPQTP
ncbi:MAG: response regulator [Pseudomonadota bacterium]